MPTRTSSCQVVKGGRSGTSFHEGRNKTRLNGAKRAIVIDYLGLPVAFEVVRLASRGPSEGRVHVR